MLTFGQLLGVFVAATWWIFALIWLVAVVVIVVRQK